MAGQSLERLIGKYGGLEIVHQKERDAFLETVAHFGVSIDDRVVAAFAQLSRLDFASPFWQTRPDVPKNVLDLMISGIALPLINDSTTTMSLLMALKVSAAIPVSKPLLESTGVEIGSGCGILIAAMKEVGYDRVLGVEIDEEVAEISGKTLREKEYDVGLVAGDGVDVIKEVNPVDSIILSCAVTEAGVGYFQEFLHDGGRLVLPVFDERTGTENLVRITRNGSSFERELLFPGVVYVSIR